MQEVYNQWKRPSWAPSGKLFGPVWTVLYVLIAISFSELYGTPIWPIVMINLVANVLYTPMLFGFQSWPLSSASIIITLVSLIEIMSKSYENAFVFSLLVPYLLWTSFALVLHIEIFHLNN